MPWLLGVDGTQLFSPCLLSPGEIPTIEVATILNFVFVVTQLLFGGGGVCLCLITYMIA